MQRYEFTEENLQTSNTNNLEDYNKKEDVHHNPNCSEEADNRRKYLNSVQKEKDAKIIPIILVTLSSIALTFAIIMFSVAGILIGSDGFSVEAIILIIFSFIPLTVGVALFIALRKISNAKRKEINDSRDY